MKILMSMISNSPTKVQHFLDHNYKNLINPMIHIKLLVSFNGLDEDTDYENLNTHGVDVELRKITNLIDKDGNYHWNSARLFDITGYPFDYVHLIDDDVVFTQNLIHLYGNLVYSKHKFVQVTAHRIKSGVYDNTDEVKSILAKKKLVGYVQFNKTEEITDRHKVTAGGHIIAKDFLVQHYAEFKSYDIFNEDTWRCYVAMKNGNCYATTRKLAISEYNSRQYNAEQKYESLVRFLELGVPVYVNYFNSITPLISTKYMMNCCKVGDLIYCDRDIPTSLVRKYISRNPEVKVEEVR